MQAPTSVSARPSVTFGSSATATAHAAIAWVRPYSDIRASASQLSPLTEAPGRELHGSPCLLPRTIPKGWRTGLAARQLRPLFPVHPTTQMPSVSQLPVSSLVTLLPSGQRVILLLVVAPCLEHR